MGKRPDFGYDPKTLPRELKDYYISADQADIKSMLNELDLNDIKEVYSHLPGDILFETTPKVLARLSYEDLANHLFELSQKNNQALSFLGDGAKNYQVPEIVEKVASIRGLTTAYTPYQPERSQGTLATLWLYSSCLSMITGFEAINASFYDRSTCLFEALKTAERTSRGKKKLLVCENIGPQDIEVLHTHAKYTDIDIEILPISKETGLIDIDLLIASLEKNKGNVSAFAFAQVNTFGLVENVDVVTDLIHQYEAQVIAVIDPVLIAADGLKPPVEFGTQGADYFVAEGQHLTLAPNYGGPGLGIFGTRFGSNPKQRSSIRNTAGRFIGAAKDAHGNECKSIVLSTREQHIRREKATSNICSNQSFVASLAGAAMLARGDKGFSAINTKTRSLAKAAYQELTRFEGVEEAFKYAPFFNEIALKLPIPASDLIEKACKKGIHLGIDISQRVAEDKDNYILISFFDVHNEKDIQILIDFFKENFVATGKGSKAPMIPADFLRKTGPKLPSFKTKELYEYYQELGEQNVSPDENIYPLGSCTMKYNPYINDWAAGLEQFTASHPQAPESEVQGSLEILYHTQEIFKNITGLAGVTTQPVAGAQGELVGLKMFQAYHADKGELEQRDVILIPRSAHGTNPATATMAGIKKIVPIDAGDDGQIKFDQLEAAVKEYNHRIIGVMVTNPNTAGIFESQFKRMSELIHSVGGLVYMDGANMNAIANIVDLNKLGVDAVHNNLHKTWTIPHGGGGPGDAIVAVSEKLLDYMPGEQVNLVDGTYSFMTPKKSIGSFHRHHGNFAHKVRAYTYLRALGPEGIVQMSSVAVLSAQYLYKKLNHLPSLPARAQATTRMHEFILGFSDEMFKNIEQKAGVPKAKSIASIGKLYLDFGLHAPTVAFPEPFGLMIEPTESYSKSELDRFIEVVQTIYGLLNECPEVLNTAPHFTPIARVDETGANKDLKFFDVLNEKLPEIKVNRVSPNVLREMLPEQIAAKIIEAHKKESSSKQAFVAPTAQL